MKRGLGQVILDLEAYELTAEEKELLKHPQVAGIILFARNYASRKQLSHLTKAIRGIRPELLIAVDQEGGGIQRFREEFTILPSLQEIGLLYDTDPAQACQNAEQAAKIMAEELLSVDVDFSFAPVLDIDYGLSTVIQGRSFHKDPQAVTAMGRAYIEGLKQLGMPAVGKHFPGHGGVRQDSHYEIAIDSRAYDDLYGADMRPFIELSFFLAGIMPAHVIYPAVDDKPSSLSKHWLKQILRQELSFTGAILSDCLSMRGLSMIVDMTERVRLALDAGCDAVLVCNARPAAIKALESLEFYYDEHAAKRLLTLRRKNK